MHNRSMFRRKTKLLLLTAVLISASGCTSVPQGSPEQITSGPNKSSQAFLQDQEECRAQASQAVTGQVAQANNQTVTGGAIGAAFGGLLGAAAGNTRGAITGAIAGGVVGAAAGSNLARNQASVQRNYDQAYAQCMSAKGNQAPGSQPQVASSAVTPGSPQSAPPIAFRPAPTVQPAPSGQGNVPQTSSAEAGGYNIPASRGLASFATMFDRACSAPADYQQKRNQMRNLANSSEAIPTELVTGQRNDYMRIDTDAQIYELYYPDACNRISRLTECLQNRSYTAEEACDCVAGYVGDVQTGAGAGELIAGAYANLGISACRAAMERATGRTKARYLAQMARAQLYTNDESKVIGWLVQASSDGYGRAQVDIARAYARDIELGVASNPSSNLTNALTHLRLAQLVGAREVSIVAEAIQEMLSVKKINYDFANAWIRMSSGNGGSSSGAKSSCGSGIDDTLCAQIANDHIHPNDH